MDKPVAHWKNLASGDEEAPVSTVAGAARVSQPTASSCELIGVCGMAGAGRPPMGLLPRRGVSGSEEAWRDVPVAAGATVPLLPLPGGELIEAFIDTEVAVCEGR